MICNKDDSGRGSRIKDNILFRQIYSIRLYETRYYNTLTRTRRLPPDLFKILITKGYTGEIKLRVVSGVVTSPTLTTKFLSSSGL